MLNKSKAEHLQIWRQRGASDAPAAELHSRVIITPRAAGRVEFPVYILSSTSPKLPRLGVLKVWEWGVLSSPQSLKDGRAGGWSAVRPSVRDWDPGRNSCEAGLAFPKLAPLELNQ